MGNKTLIIGDIHLGKGISIGKPGIGGAYNSRIVDQKRLLDWISETAYQEHVYRLILTGDVFEDVKPDYTLVQIFIDWLKDLELHNIDVHIIVGNHDIKRSGSFYSSILDVVSACDFEHVYVYKNITTILTPGAGFTLLPFRDRRGLGCESNTEALKMLEERLAYERAEIPGTDQKVLIGHLTLEGAIYIDEIDDLLNELMCPLKMFHGYDYVWMGHVHKPQVKSRNPHIAHIGSLDLSDFGETDHQKILILFDPDSDDKFKSIPVPSRPLRRIKINVPEGNDSTEFVLEQIKDFHNNFSLKNALVKIEITLNGQEAVSADRKKIEEYIYSLGTFYISSLSESKNISVIPLEKRDLVDNTIDEKSAIKLYANMLNFETEEDQNEFVSLCIEVVDEFRASVKD